MKNRGIVKSINKNSLTIEIFKDTKFHIFIDEFDSLGKVRDYIKQGLSYRGFLWTSGTPDLKIQGISS